MSWDIFVQDIPALAASIADIPDDFAPSDIGSPSSIIKCIQDVIPFADFTDPTWITVTSDKIDMEISLGSEDPVHSFTFHIRSGEYSPIAIAEILSRLGLRAFDPQSDSGIFEIQNAKTSFEGWEKYRNHILTKIQA